MTLFGGNRFTRRKVKGAAGPDQGVWMGIANTVKVRFHVVLAYRRGEASPTGALRCALPPLRGFPPHMRILNKTLKL